MTLRLKWDIALVEKHIPGNKNSSSEIGRETILELLDNNSLTTHFQPIFSAKDGSVYGYEALTRIKEDDNSKINIGELFKKAMLTNTISSLDVRCRENAIRLGSFLGINQTDAYLTIPI